jgi:hypothetical protein
VENELSKKELHTKNEIEELLMKLKESEAAKVVEALYNEYVKSTVNLHGY